MRREMGTRVGRFRHVLSTSLLALLLSACGVAVATLSEDQTVTSDSAGASSTAKGNNQIELTIDYGDGVEKRFKALPWTEGLTVLEALQAADKHPRGIELAFRGSGSTSFVYRIDDLENRGAKGWTYQVDGQAAKKSAGVSSLRPGSKVLWKFGALR